MRTIERQLTERERRILRLIADGLTTREVAAELGISEARVENDVYRARAKLAGLSRKRVKDRGQAVAVARDLGLIE